MFGISFTELVVIFLVALVLFGPEQLPQIARQFGRLMGELKRGTDSVRREFYNSVYPPMEEVKRDLAASTRELRSIKTSLRSDMQSLRSDIQSGLHDATPTSSPEKGLPLDVQKTEGSSATDGKGSASNVKDESTTIVREEE